MLVLCWSKQSTTSRGFILWRRDYYSSFAVLPKNAKLPPTDKTLQFDMMVGKAIVRWAHEQGLRGNKPHITVSYTPKKKRVRPAFELSEFRKLWRVLCKRIAEKRSAHKAQSRTASELRAHSVLDQAKRTI
jgi:integrase